MEYELSAVLFSSFAVDNGRAARLARRMDRESPLLEEWVAEKDDPVPQL